MTSSLKIALLITAGLFISSIVMGQVLVVVQDMATPSTFYNFSVNDSGSFATVHRQDGNNYTISSYNSTGALLWNRSLLIGPQYPASGYERVTSLHLTDSGDVLFTVNEPFYYLEGLYTQIQMSAGLTKLNNSGVLEWNKYSNRIGDGTSKIHSSYEGYYLVHNFSNHLTYGNLNFYGVPIPGGVSSNYQTFIAYLDVDGEIQWHKILSSNYTTSSNNVSVHGDIMIVTGSFARNIGGPNALLSFSNQTDGTTTTYQLLGPAAGNSYMARLSLSTSHWEWWHVTEPGSEVLKIVDGDTIIKAKTLDSYSTRIRKYNLNSGDFVSTTDWQDLRCSKITQTLDGRNLFWGYNRYPGNFVHGVIDIDFEPTSITNMPSLLPWVDWDSFGNLYVDSSNAIIKYGVQGAYPVSLGMRQVDFGTCYPGVEYESEIQIFNFGNDVLSIIGASFQDSVNDLQVFIDDPATSAPTGAVTLHIFYSPSSPNTLDDTLYVNTNSIESPTISFLITGNVTQPEPKAPETIELENVDDNMIVSWSPVTETILETPIVPDYYLVFFNGSSDIDGQYYYLGRSCALSYLHDGVALHADYMFYRVRAFKFFGRSRQDFDSLGITPGMPETEVLDILRQSEE